MEEKTSTNVNDQEAANRLKALEMTYKILENQNWDGNLAEWQFKNKAEDLLAWAYGAS